LLWDSPCQQYKIKTGLSRRKLRSFGKSLSGYIWTLLKWPNSSVAPPGQRRRSTPPSGAMLSVCCSGETLSARLSLRGSVVCYIVPGTRCAHPWLSICCPSGATASVYLSLRGNAVCLLLRGNAVCLLLRGNGTLQGAIGCRTGENFVLAGPEGLQIDSSGRQPGE